jgi:hypothetical protein
MAHDRSLAQAESQKSRPARWVDTGMICGYIGRRRPLFHRGAGATHGLASQRDPKPQGAMGGRKTAERESEYFREIAAKRKTRGGGRPKKGTGRIARRHFADQPLRMPGVYRRLAVIERISKCLLCSRVEPARSVDHTEVEARRGHPEILPMCPTPTL